MGILKIPRITTTNRTGLTLGLGELVYDTDLDEIYKGDGATSGGIAIASGTGDVVGPASAVNNHVVFFDNTTGKLIKDSGLTLSGTNTGDQTITLTGDVTGSGTGSFATTIGANKVTLGMMATLSAYSIIGNNTGSSATPLALTGTQVTAILDTASATVKGVLSSADWSTFNGKQAALSGTGIVKSTSGTISYLTDNSANWDTAYTNRITSLTTTGSSGSATLVSNTLNIPTYTLAGLGGQPLATNLTSLSGLTYASASFVKMTASGTFSLDTATYLTSNQTITLSGDLSGSGTTSITASIGANKVTVAMLAQAAANSILGNNTGSAANVAYLTGTQVTAMLDTFTSTLKGLTPASGGGTTKFLRADGTWAAPYTFSTGLTESAGVVTDNLSTGVAGGQSVIGGTAASNNLTLSSTSNATKGKILFGTSSYDEANNRLGIGTASPTYPVHIVAGTLLDGQQSFYLSATSPTTRTSVYSFAQIDITSAGSSSFTQFGFNVNLLSGYTGSSGTQCGRFVNTTSGTGTNIYAGTCNVGAAANCSGTTTGANIGIGGSASGATTNIGNRSLADSNVANSTNLGMCGFANNTGTGTVYEIGGYFGLNTATPTFGASAALMCDNSTKAYDIFVARDNGTAVFKVTDNGNTIVGGLAAISTSATDGYLYLPTCAGIPTGTPTSYTGKAAMVIDTTNNKAYVYSGGAWRILN